MCLKYQDFDKITLNQFKDSSDLEKVKSLYLDFKNDFNNPKTIATDIKSWCILNNAIAKVHKLYGSNSILYMIKDSNIKENTYFKLYRCMFSLLLSNNGYKPIIEKQIPQREKLSNFINYFSNKDKIVLNDFDTYIGERNYVGRVFCGMRNLSSQNYDLFLQYKDMK